MKFSAPDDEGLAELEKVYANEKAKNPADVSNERTEVEVVLLPGQGDGAGGEDQLHRGPPRVLHGDGDVRQLVLHVETGPQAATQGLELVPLQVDKLVVF